MTSRSKLRRLAVVALWLTAALLLLGAVAFVLVLLPALLVLPEPRLEARDRVAGQNGVRAAGVAALVALGGAATATYAARTYGLNRHTYSLQVAGQQSDRYTKAIDQLGSETVSVRIGGIYALTQTLDSNERHVAMVHHILNLYVRNHAALPAVQNTLQRKSAVAGRAPRPILTEPAGLDVTIALAELRRMRASSELPRLDLRFTNLAGADLTGMDLVDARLNDANLRDVVLNDAKLTGADLRGAVLKDAHLFRTDVADVRIWHGQLDDSQLTDVIGRESMQQSHRLSGPDGQNG